MIILGVDPGSRQAGFGVIEAEGRKIKFLASGTMKYDSKLDFVDRLGTIYNSCIELVGIYKPDEISIESLIYVKSVTSLAKLAQARGAMIAAFMKKHERKVFEYSPNLVKSSVVGHGHASKENIQKGLSIIFPGKSFKSADEADALAIAICHSLNRGSVKSDKQLKRRPNRLKHLERVVK